ncbi:MAG TPA: PAS domain S-box protein, partial [Nitrospinota bacterium]|nr:PAS domain S-box protein [Nitrospinota bacterium]
MTHTENKSLRFFPVKVFAAALVLTIAVFAGLGWHVWNSYRNFEIIKLTDFRLQELSGIITHLDEVLTMSARMAASTGDLWWEERYLVFEPKLDAAIKEAMKLEPKIFMSEAAAQTNTANLKLVAIEKQAFDLVRQGHPEKAAFLLFGDEYENQKRIYSEGIKNVTVALQERAKSNLHRQRRQAFLAVLSIVITIPILLFVWFFALRSMRRHVIGRKRAEEALKKSEEEYRKLVETMNEGLGIADKNYILTYVNSKFSDMLGYSKHEMLGHHLLEFIAEDYQALMKEQIAERKKGDAAPFELVWRSKYGRRVHTLASPKGIFDSKGHFKGSFGVLTDITEFKKAEEELKKKAGQLKTLFEVDKKIASIVSREELLPWIAKQAARLLEADECVYRIREGDYLLRGGGTKEGMELMKTEKLKIGE